MSEACPSEVHGRGHRSGRLRAMLTFESCPRLAFASMSDVG